MSAELVSTPIPEKGPIESKVWASLVGAGSGTVISTFLLWLLGCGIWTHDWSTGAAKASILAVPDPLSAIVLLGITAGLTFAGGYLAKHTPRLDRQAMPENGPPVWNDGDVGLNGDMGGQSITHSIHSVDPDRTDSAPERAFWPLPPREGEPL